MVFSWLLSYFSLLLLLTTQATIVAWTEFVHYCGNNHPCLDNYTANSDYESNLNALLINLSSNTQIDYGFYNFSYGRICDHYTRYACGKIPETAYAIGLCRGDLEPQVCRSCLNDSRVQLTQQCPNQKEAIGYRVDCTLRYSNSSSIFDTSKICPGYYDLVGGNATDVEKFNGVLMELLNNLRSRAASGDSLRKFATGNETRPNFQDIYALVQCTPDLSEVDCSGCLADAMSEIQTCCYGHTRVRIGRPSCNLRFEDYPFYDAAADTTPPPPPPPPFAPSNDITPITPPPPPLAPSNDITPIKGGKSNTSRTVIIIVVSAAAPVILVVFICIIMRKPMRRRSYTEFEIEVEESLQFDFDTIRGATNNFSDENKLGEGGFGPVYKGKLSNGQDIAVKRLSRASNQGDMEFKNEVMLVAKLQHRNLVKLLGFCLEKRERLLVYEFAQNKSLNQFIFDPTKRIELNWEKRYKIIEGIVRGLLYLHEDSLLRIIHRDLKLSNILLDQEMNPKISDFGTAKLFVDDQTRSSTSNIVGTYGYMAPEYLKYGKLSAKSDIFSFGVMVLEIVSGRKRSEFWDEDEGDLLSFAWRKWREGIIAKIVDPSLNDVSGNEIMRCIHIGLLCVQEHEADRPKMASVLLMLNSSSAILPVPLQPAFYFPRRDLSDRDSTQSSKNNSRVIRPSEDKNNPREESVNEASITELSCR